VALTSLWHWYITFLDGRKSSIEYWVLGASTQPLVEQNYSEGTVSRFYWLWRGGVGVWAIKIGRGDQPVRQWANISTNRFIFVYCAPALPPQRLAINVVIKKACPEREKMPSSKCSYPQLTREASSRIWSSIWNFLTFWQEKFGETRFGWRSQGAVISDKAWIVQFRTLREALFEHPVEMTQYKVVGHANRDQPLRSYRIVIM
jgi:hypothetical protein